MKKSTKKGFTLVELVIVIAVIAILSAILVPTFGNIIANANATKAQGNAKAAITTHTALTADDTFADMLVLEDGYIYCDGHYMTYTNGNLGPATTTAPAGIADGDKVSSGTPGEKWKQLYTAEDTTKDTAAARYTDDSGVYFLKKTA